MSSDAWAWMTAQRLAKPMRDEGLGVLDDLSYSLCNEGIEALDALGVALGDAVAAEKRDRQAYTPAGGE